jgi:hypothetical protein
VLSILGHPLLLLSDSQICEATTAADIAVEFSAFLHSIDYSPEKIMDSMRRCSTSREQQELVFKSSTKRRKRHDHFILAYFALACFRPPGGRFPAHIAGLREDKDARTVIKEHGGEG